MESDPNVSWVNANEFVEYASTLNIADDNFKKWLTTVESSGTVYKTSEEALAAYQTYLQSTSTSLTLADIKTKALSVSMKVFSTIGWMALFAGVSWAIGKAVEGIDHLINHEKYAQKALESALETSKKFKDSISNTREELSKTKKSVSEIVSEYAKLSQGVDIYTNENISLTNEQYEEFIFLNNQLAELFPSLTRNYDENGNAILGLGGSVESVTDKIQTLIEQQERLATIEMRKSLEGYVNGDEDGNGGQIEVLKGLEDNLEKAANELTKFKEKYDAIFNGKQVDEDFLNGKQLEKAKDYYKNAFGLTEEELKKSTAIEKNFLGEGVYRLDFKNLEIDESRKEEILEFYNSFYKELNDDILYAQSELDTANKEMSNMMMMWVEYESLYKDGGNTFQTLIQSIIGDIDWNQLGIENYDDAKTWIKDNIFRLISSVDGDDKNILTNALGNLLSLDLNNLPIGEVKEKIDEYLAVIAEILGQESADKLKVNLGFDNVDTLVNNVKGKLQDSFDDKVSELSLEDLEIAANKLEIDPSVPLSWDELIAKIEEYKASLKEGNESPILSITDTITQLNTQLKPAFDSLKSAYQDIFTDDDFTLKNVDISMLAGIKSQLESLGKELNVEIDCSSFEDFASVLNDTESTEYDVQKAFNELATTITNTALSGVEDFETLKAALEDFGIENSELVAFENLIGNTESLKKAGLDLATASEAQIIAFANEVVSAENVVQAIDMLTFAKLSADAANMDTSTEVANLKTLAENAGYTGDVIKYLTELEQIYQGITSGTIPSADIPEKLERAKELTALIQSSENNINYEPKFNGNSGKSSASKAGKEAANAYLEAFEKELQKLDDLKSQGKISEKQYLDALRRLYVKYFNQKKKYLDQYEKYESQYLQGKLYALCYSNIVLSK